MLRTKTFKLMQCSLCNKNLLQRSGLFNRCGSRIRLTNQPAYFLSTKVTSNYKVSPSSEQEFLVKIKNDPDTFGSAADKDPEPDEGDLEEAKYFEEQPLPSQKLRIKEYADIIKGLISKRKIKEAIDTLEVRIIKQDRVKPESYLYNLILGACGRVGYTKKAFMLYNDMKKRGFEATGGTYTALFNACSNSPWPEDGLSRAKHLRNIMIEKLYEPNDSNYNAMIKAFGRCGDISTAFAIADEMVAKRFKLKDDTLSFLLQACISDKEAGFRHALLIWHKFQRLKVKPSIYNYNLMLRCIRECGLGNEEATKDVIDKILLASPAQTENKLLANKNPLQIVAAADASQENADSQVIEENVNQIIENRPNLMAKVPHLGNIISLSEVTKPEDRLILVGGFSGILRHMEENQCPPNVKTYTLLLDSLPSSLAAENELLQNMKHLNVHRDIDFYNMLIKRRSMRFDYENAKVVVDMLKEDGYRPNLITYGVLSLACKTKEEALCLLEEMNEAGFRINIEILGAMLRQACYHNNFSYVFEIMNITLREEIKPSKKFLEILENFKKKCKDVSADEDHAYNNKKFRFGYKDFKNKLTKWLEKVEIDDQEDAHPWQQFRQTTNTNVKYFKGKEERFKARHISLFKQKQTDKKKVTLKR